VDELRTALELATEDELRDLTEILFRRKFNPLDYVNTPDPIDIQSQNREEWLNALESRFRFLAADGVTVLQRRTEELSYRQILIQVCRYLKLPYAGSMSTTDLEAEIFLHLLSRAWESMTIPERKALSARVKKSLSTSQLAQQLPLPIRQDPMGLVLKGGSALAVSSVIQPLLLKLIARQFAIHFATYQVAKEAIVRGGTAAAIQFQNQVILQTAGRNMAMSAARYGAVRSVFAFMGPMLWAWFFADLGWRSIATNYGRVIPTIFALAQIRLTRAECFEAI
jgi:uncharacterized protein YaaW (UPF0174 family)